MGKLLTVAILTLGSLAASQTEAPAQERLKIAYSSADASNTVWFTALDAGFYRKHGLDVELIFIQSSTMSVSTVVSGDIHVANTSGGAVASAVAGGANLVMTACYVNTLPYELVVQESVRSAEDLRGKSVGISRVGSASDVAARVLIKGLGLEPVKDVPILQVGGPSERAAAFRTGRIAGFPSPPGTIHLAKGMPHRVMISTADFQKRFDFPYICSTTTRTYLAAKRDTMRRLTMALIEATYFLKTRKEETKKLIAKYTRQSDARYLEDSYTANVKLHDRVPLVTREGMEVQIQEALSRKPGVNLKVDDIVDDSIVRELEKSGFIDRVYR
ncbi:MAG TPA: ABC transporter substrate-binding protein [Candidatus Binatia bacterium]|nr:ABC transporter substrate-binding protein [Candidatus Binatia bacterium]